MGIQGQRSSSFGSQRMLTRLNPRDWISGGTPEKPHTVLHFHLHDSLPGLHIYPPSVPAGVDQIEPRDRYAGWISIPLRRQRVLTRLNRGMGIQGQRSSSFGSQRVLTRLNPRDWISGGSPEKPHTVLYLVTPHENYHNLS